MGAGAQWSKLVGSNHSNRRNSLDHWLAVRRNVWMGEQMSMENDNVLSLAEETAYIARLLKQAQDRWTRLEAS